MSERRVELLDQLIGEQAYLLSYWRVAPEEIDYRRFFDITDLVALRQQLPDVFEATHAFVVELVREGKVTGLRVDHVDGLLDPTGYLGRLRKHVGGRCYVVAEKILAQGEEPPGDWPVAGTTGYEFVNAVTDLFVDPDGEARLRAVAARFTGNDEPFTDVVRRAKRQVMAELFGGEVEALAARLQRLARQDRRSRDLRRSELARALVEVTAWLPVYRTYVRDRNLRTADHARITEAFRGTQRELPAEAAPALDFLKRVLLLNLPRRAGGERVRAWVGFVMRWQQFTGAVMAKGLEDTAMYLSNALVSRNEVGGDPGRPTGSSAELHRKNRARLRSWPHALSPLSTHDAKRSEDVRARIDVISEMADQWAERIDRWSRWNRSKKHEVGGSLAPDPSDELLFYQTLVGVWPLAKKEERGLTTRLQDYMLKVVREAKAHTSWIDPDPEYESAVAAFVQAVAAPANRRFRKDLLDVLSTIAFHGALNGLSQTVLQVASPGVPDVYQGTETWNLTLVDPDNRRRPDLARLARELSRLERQSRMDAGSPALAAELMRTWQDGRVKLLVTSRALQHRRANQELFETGSYRALSASARWNDHVVAFARQQRSNWAVAVVPRLTLQLAGAENLPVGIGVWGSGNLTLPARAPRRWVNALTGEPVSSRSRRGSQVILLADVFATFPAALLAPA